MLPREMRPGGWTRRMIDSAVTDLPLPDSPTRPSVSPARMSKLMSLTAGTGPWSESKTVVRCSTVSSAPSVISLQPSALACVRVFAKDAPQRVGDFANGGLRFDRGDDSRHEILAAARRLRHAVEGARHGALAAARAHGAQTL